MAEAPRPRESAPVAMKPEETILTVSSDSEMDAELPYEEEEEGTFR